MLIGSPVSRAKGGGNFKTAAGFVVVHHELSDEDEVTNCRGQTVSSVINLSESQLNQRLRSGQSASLGSSTNSTSSPLPSVGLVGANLVQLEQSQEHSDRLNIVARWANLAALFDQDEQQPSPEVLVLQLPVLSAQDIAKAQQALPGCRIVSTYQFATAAELSLCQQQDAPVLKWPLDWREIEYTCLEESKNPVKSSGYANRRFTDEELIALAVGDDDPNLPTQQLVEAIHQINALSGFLQSCADEQTTNTSQSAALGVASSDASWARTYLESALHSVSARQPETSQAVSTNEERSGNSVQH